MLYSELQCSDAIHKAVERMGFAEMTPPGSWPSRSRRSWKS